MRREFDREIDAKVKTGKVADSLSVIMLILCVAVVFWGTLGNGFVSWDDRNYLLDNPYVHGLSADNLREIFSSFRNGNYHPLPLLSYAVEYEFFGLSSRGYHAVSLLWHAGNAILVFTFLRALRINAWAAFAATLLYALHPMRVEAVAWVTGRKDLMCTGFSLGALLAYVAWTRSGRRRDYWLVLGLFLLALLSKGTALVLPPLFLFIDRLEGRKLDRQVIMEKLPHAVLALVFTLVAFMARASFQEVLEETGFGLAAMLATGAYRLVFYYVARTLLPAPQLFSPYPPTAGILDGWVVAACLALVIFGVLFWWKQWLFSEVSIGFWFFLVALLPALFLPVVGYSADRFAYFPSIGLTYSLGWGLARISRPVVMAGVVLLPGVLLTWLTVERCKVWHDSVSLYNDSIVLFGGRSGQERNLARAYANRGNAFRDSGRRETALADYDHSVRIDPAAPQPWVWRGELLIGMGQLSAASASFEQALQLAPELSSAWIGRSIALRQLGKLDQALATADQAVRLTPNDAVAFNTRGLALRELGRYQEAIADFDRVIALAPLRFEGYLNRGGILDSLGRKDLAASDFAQVLRLDPDNRAAKAWLSINLNGAQLESSPPVRQ